MSNSSNASNQSGQTSRRQTKAPSGAVISGNLPRSRGRKGTSVVEQDKAQSRPAPAQRSPRLSGTHGLSFSTCVKTLSGVTISRRGLLHLELAVGLAVFLDAGVANKGSKNMLQEIYSRAGYDCADSKGKDYKTVNRRIQASAGLFGKVSLEVLNHWVDGTKEGRLLHAISQQIVQFGFESMDDVLDHVGRTSNRTGTGKGKGAGKKVGVERAWDIEVALGEEKTMHFKLPKTLTEAQLFELSAKIAALAEGVHEARLEAEKAAAEGAQTAQAVAGEAVGLEVAGSGAGV